MAKKKLQLTEKERLFCEHYYKPESDTFSNGIQSAIKAGYPEEFAGQMAYKAKKKPQVIARRDEIYKENEPTIGRVMTNLVNDRRLAQKKDDVQAMIRADELLGKRLKLFSERTVIETGGEEQQALTKEQEIQAQVMAELALRHGAEIRSEIERRSESSRSIDFHGGDGSKDEELAVG